MLLFMLNENTKKPCNLMFDIVEISEYNYEDTLGVVTKRLVCPHGINILCT